MQYPVENFSESERKLLEPHFSNLDLPVFALTNLPETIKGALFARYSRYPGTLRRLYLEEFAQDVGADERPFAGQEGKRAAELYERIFVGYGDDSIAQVGGAHIACEWVSNILTKVLQRGRLAAYLEQSTRYIAYDQPMSMGDGADAEEGYRYYRSDDLGPAFTAAMDEIFAIYSASLEPTMAWAAERFPQGDEPEKAWEGSIKAKALDLLRGLLPAATLSHVGMFASGQAYEQLLLRMLSSPLPEAREFGGMILSELGKVIPSFVSRVDRPERGGEWISYLSNRREVAERAAARYGLDARGRTDDGPTVELLDFRGSERELLAASLYEQSSVGEAEIRRKVADLDDGEVAASIAEMVGSRANRRHRPGRGWEAVGYRFEVVSDYGAFRDLQRHRMLTCQWQRLTPDLGAAVPEELVEAGLGDQYSRALEISATEFDRLESEGLASAAPYALCLGYRIRYLFDLNAREAMQMIELRSGQEGHPSYRAVAQAMHDLIAAVHASIARALEYVVTTSEPRLERILSEIRTHHKRVEAGLDTPASDARTTN